MPFAVERDLDAPIDRVWAAWTTPADLERWYSPGPVDWQVDELDVRPGGRFRMRMESPDGEHVAEGTFHDVEAPHRLVQGPADASMTIRTTLFATTEGTHMVVAMDGLPEDQYERMEAAWNQGFDKLARLLGQTFDDPEHAPA